MPVFLAYRLYTICYKSLILLVYLIFQNHTHTTYSGSYKKGNGIMKIIKLFSLVFLITLINACFELEEVGELCDGDCDNIADSIDNCRLVYNPDQLDSDADGIGDLCDSQDYTKATLDNPGGSDYALDYDNDGTDDNDDVCPSDPNTGSDPDFCINDDDSDGAYNHYDPCPADPIDACNPDSDNDGIVDSEEWPGCENDNSVNANGFLTCGNDVNAESLAAYSEWFAQFYCHRTNDSTCTADSNETGDNQQGDLCTRGSGASGTMTWSSDTGADRLTFVECGYITEACIDGISTGCGGIAGYHLKVNGMKRSWGEGATNGDRFWFTVASSNDTQSSTLTVTVLGGTPSFSTTGSYQFTVFERRDIHAKIPTVNHTGSSNSTSPYPSYSNDAETDKHSSYIVITCPASVPGCDGLPRRYNAKTQGTHPYSGRLEILSYDEAQTNGTEIVNHY